MSDRMSTIQMHNRSINALLDQQKNLSDMQFKISTGKQVNTPADDPIASSRLLNLRQQQYEISSYQNNIDIATSALTLEETQLTELSKILSQASVLAIQAANGGCNSNNLRDLSLQFQQLLDQAVGISNTVYNGEYMFSGAKSVLQPVTSDGQGGYVYLGDETQRTVNIGSAIAVAINDSGRDVFFDIPSDNINLNNFSGLTLITSSNPGLQNSGSLNALTADELLINNITIAPATSDGVSTSDASASAIASARAINQTTALHGVHADVNATVLDFTNGTFASGALASGDFTINGINIVGTPLGASVDDLVELINNIGGVGVPGVIASNNAGQLRLTASDARNIQITTNGTSTSGITFSNFDLSGAASLNRIKRGDITLKTHKNINIAGSQPSAIGLTAGTYNVTNNSGTCNVSGVHFSQIRPASALNNEKYLIKFSSSNTFNIYRESDYNTPVTNVQTIPNGANYHDITTINNYPITYTSGANYIVDGIQFTLTGTPVANDTFTIELNPVAYQDVFSTLSQCIYAVTNYAEDNPRLNYELGVVQKNLSNAADNISSIISKVGARQNLADTQKASNKNFDYYLTQAISDIQDLDLVSAISSLVAIQTAYEASQQTFIRIQKLSIFDLLLMG